VGGTTVSELRPQPPLLDVDVDGALVTLRARYDPELVERLKQLPGRRYLPEETAWVLPARREALVALAQMLVDLGDRVELSERARRRLQRQGPGRLELRDGQFEIHAAPRPQRLERLRALPERRWIAEQRCWRVAATRAGALALSVLVNDGELVATSTAATRLDKLAAAQPATGARVQQEVGAERASPLPHWRHVTRGSIFNANPKRREWVDGVGWCVRVRVHPQPREAEPTR
jgi:hypothetical protein